MPEQKPISIHLVLTYRGYDAMLAGRKDVEYRELTPHWERLIWTRARHIRAARFSRGYTTTTITRPVLHISVGPCPYAGWSGDYYRLHLGPIIKPLCVNCGHWQGKPGDIGAPCKHPTSYRGVEYSARDSSSVLKEYWETGLYFTCKHWTPIQATETGA